MPAAPAAIERFLLEDKSHVEKSQEGRVEELSKKTGGRFRFTSLVQKQMRDYGKID